jgi:hypothetical protein
MATWLHGYMETLKVEDWKENERERERERGREERECFSMKTSMGQGNQGKPV